MSVSRSIPPLLVERAALGELSPEQMKSCQERFGVHFDQALQDLRDQNQAWFKAPDRERELQQIRARVQRIPRPNRARRWLAFSAATCACAGLLLVLRADRQGGVVQESGVKVKQESRSFRLKGLAPHLTLHRKLEQGQEQLSSGSRARTGDLIQLSYVAAGASFGVVVSVDGRGQTTLHFPKSLDGDPRLSSEGAVPLERAYELDDAPHFERFFFVTARGSAAPKDFARRVMQQIETFSAAPLERVSKAPLPLPASWSQADFLLKKEERPS